MDVKTATEIANAQGAFFLYNPTIKLYTIYVGDMWTYLRPEDLNVATETQFKMFVGAVLMHEQESVMRYGQATLH